MAMIMDAIARHGIRGAIRSLLSPQNTTSDSTEKHTPRYVCAHKKYESGRKGRTCVYRIGDEHTNRGGRKARIYVNVEGANLDDDERQSFTGIEHTRCSNMGHSTRHKKHGTLPAPDGVVKAKRSKSDGMAPSQAKDLSPSSNKNSVVLRPVNDRMRSRSEPHSDQRGGVGVVERRHSPSRTPIRHKVNQSGNRMSREVPPQNQPGDYCSGALPIPQHQLDRLSLEAAPTEPLRKLPGTSTDSVVSGAPGNPFRQPGLTSQESSDLVFGIGCETASRMKLRAGRFEDRVAQDVHEFVPDPVRDHPLGDAEQKTEARSPSHSSDAVNLNHFPSGVSDAQKSQSFPKQSLQQTSPSMSGIVHAQAGAQSYRFLSTATAGTPPYTPDKDESNQK